MFYWWNYPLFQCWECCKSMSQVHGSLHLPGAVSLLEGWCLWRSCAIHPVGIHLIGAMGSGSEMVAFKMFLHQELVYEAQGLHWAATAPLFVHCLEFLNISVRVAVISALPSSASSGILSLSWKDPEMAERSSCPTHSMPECQSCLQSGLGGNTWVLPLALEFLYCSQI